MTEEATIRRGARNARYTAVPNHVFEDQRLSMEARWLLGYLLSKPDGWIVRLGDIRKRGGCGRDKARSMVGELVEAGYAEKEAARKDDGKFNGLSLVIYDEPISAPTATVASLPQTEKPATAEPSTVQPSTVNPPLVNTESTAIPESSEREREREEDPKKIESEGWALLKNWPQFDGMPKEPAMKVWRTLPAEERATARRRFLPWMELLRKQHKGRVPAPSTYLTEKLWQAVPDPMDAPPPPKVVTPFSKIWTAVWLVRCLAGPGRVMAPSRFIQSIIDEGGERGERERLEHQVRHGYRGVHLMADAAARGVGLTLRPEERAIEPHAESFVPVNAKSDLAREWRDAFERRGWPSLPDPGKHEWLYFPAGGPASGLATFELAVRGENDAGRSEAAE